MMAHLGATMPVIEPGYVEIHMAYDARLTQQQGYVHGGALATIADSAAGFAAFTLMAEDQQPLTVPGGSRSAPASRRVYLLR